MLLRFCRIVLLLGLPGLMLACGLFADADFSPEARAYFAAIKANDLPLKKPQPGEWLYENQEHGQTLKQYQQLPIVRPDSVRHTLYLLPVGRFSPLQQQVLQATRQYLQSFFQLPVVLLPTVSDTFVPQTARRQGTDGQEQLLAPYILSQRLNGQIPPDGLALMALSAQDLYPKPEWNYVFGLASYPDRVGVTSLYRLQDTQLTTRNYTRCLTRLIAISSHELGHMFSLRHCTHARCVMNGTNSLTETDSKPNRLCSQCQTKLYWACRYDNRKRLQELQSFFRAANLRRDAYAASCDWKRLD
jgi:archaemetzincin